MEIYHGLPAWGVVLLTQWESNAEDNVAITNNIRSLAFIVVNRAVTKGINGEINWRSVSC